MIFYSWGKKVVPLADIGLRQCSACGDFRPFRVVLNYSYFRLYWLFGVATKKRYIVACANCNRGALVEKSQVETLASSTAASFPSVPFMDRWGLAILAAAGITIVAALAIK